ncbi:MAG: hypothetical protein AB1567_03495 [bacterium]
MESTKEDTVFHPILGKDYDLGDEIEIDEEDLNKLLKEEPVLPTDGEIFVDRGDHIEIIGTIGEKISMDGDRELLEMKGDLEHIRKLKVIIAPPKKEEDE